MDDITRRNPSFGLGEPDGLAFRAVTALAVVSVLGIIGMVVLGWQGKDIPPALAGATGSAVTALGMLLGRRNGVMH